MTDLDRLIEAVEAGELDFAALKGWCDITRTNGTIGEPVMNAFHGSLDAAKRLHDALLPGWTPGLQMQDDTRWFCELREGHCTSYDRVEISIAPDPARAWLLAILRAVKAKAQL